MSRARVVIVALLLAVAAAWALAGLRGPSPSEAPAHGEIDEASREELERVLRETRDAP